MASETSSSARPGVSGTQQGQTQGQTQAQAKALWDDAKQTARATVDERQRSAVSGIGEFAGAFRNAAQQIDSNQNPTTARLAGQAADALDRMSSSLKNKDLDSLLRDTERFARSQPALFLGVAVAAGFLAVRFLKSSSPEQGGNYEGGNYEGSNYAGYDRASGYSPASSSAGTNEQQGDFNAADYRL